MVIFLAVVIISAAALVVQPPVDTLSVEHVAAVSELSDLISVFQISKTHRASVADQFRRPIRGVAERRHGEALFDGL